MRLSGKEKVAYGLGAVGKDMVYMLSASYVLYYYQDILGVSTVAMGIILLVARIFDAFNDPIMGIVVARTKTKWGKFRPWLLIGTITNAVMLYFLYAAPPTLSGGGLIAYAAIFYILWGVTYTMMDIPYWSMVPAFTQSGKERENLSALARSCAGVGSALISVVAIITVNAIGKAVVGEEAPSAIIERTGFKWFALIVAVLFIVFTLVTCICIKEKSSVDMEAASVKDMFKSLIRNDQAMIMVIAIVLVNTAVYITNNLVIYFFKYDIANLSWQKDYTLFTMFGGGMQVLAMMLFFPLLRKLWNTMKIFYLSIGSAILGYAVLLAMALTGTKNIYILFIPAFFIMSAVGILNVIVTVFLANTVDYGEWKNNRRDESVIFSMQTFVVKLASGLAALVASLCLHVFKIGGASKDEVVTEVVKASGSSLFGLRLTMTIIPIVVLAIAVLIFRKKYCLNDEKLKEITTELSTRR
ncbi:MAG: glycoside-pentoside-hexuronide (GPH):cation symporter [Lachnospiraceae bacterium]|nr:glycoside-pentoside-hexuronide (GPH):cation symporter [Lachnospiraceae bacterium]